MSDYSSSSDYRDGSDAALTGLRGRFNRTRVEAWLAAHRWQAVFAVVGLVAVAISTMAAWQTVGSLIPQKHFVRLDTALWAVDRGDDMRAIQIASMFLPWSDLPEPRQWIAPYVFGMVNTRRADRYWGERGRQQHLLAARYLEEALNRGLPEIRRSRALLDLGRNQILAGQAARAIPHLEQLSDLDNEYSSAGRQLLATAYAELPTPDWQVALAHNADVLADATVVGGEREAALVLQGRGQIELKNLTAAQETLASIPNNSRHRAEALFWIGSALAKIDGLARSASLKQACEILESCMVRDNWSPRWAPPALLLRARCRSELGNRRGALADIAEIHRLYPDTLVDQAAHYDSATLLRQLGQLDEALAQFQFVITALPPLDRWHNPWLSVQQLRRPFLEAYDEWITSRDFERAAKLGSLADRVVGAAEAAKLATDAFTIWSDLDRERTADLTYAEQQRALANRVERHREMADFYQRLARLQRSTRDYPELIWKAAEHRRAAREYGAAVDLLDDYIASFDKPRRTQAFLVLAECRLALDQPTEALAVLTDLADLPNADVARTRMPLLAARAYLLRDQAEPAELELLKILDGDQLAPESVEWRDSLIAYARLLYDHERYESAAIRWEEVLARYPQSDVTSEAQYLLAESYRRAGALVDPKNGPDSADENLRQSGRESAMRRYEAALQAYQATIDRLSISESEARISPPELTMLRNALFGRGSVLFALERHEDAIAAYLSAVHRYQDTPEVLDALVQIADCYRRLNRPVEARGTLLQARLVLQRLPQTASFTETTNYSRAEWSELLEALIAL